MIFKLLSLVPFRVWIALAAAAGLIAGYIAIDRHGYNRGAESVRVKWEAERQAQLAEIAKLKARQADVVEKVVIQYRDRVKVVKEKGDEIVHAVPVYVHGECLLPGGWRVLHDAAARGELPKDPERAIAAAAAVEDVTAARTVAENYSACRENAERLSALQQLLKDLP